MDDDEIDYYDAPDEPETLEDELLEEPSATSVEPVSRIVTGADRKSRRFMTTYEQARLIGTRAAQIANGSPVLVETKHSDPIMIAWAEFKAFKFPIQIRRNMPDGTVEIWDVKDFYNEEDPLDPFIPEETMTRWFPEPEK